MPRTGWPRSWLQAGRTRRCSTCPAGGFQPAGLVALRLFSCLSQGCWPFTAELTRLVRCSSTSTTLPRSWSVPLGLHTTLRQARNTASAPHPPAVPMVAAPKNTTSCLARQWRFKDNCAISLSNCSHAHKAHTGWLTWWHQVRHGTSVLHGEHRVPHGVHRCVHCCTTGLTLHRSLAAQQQQPLPTDARQTVRIDT
ncbi:hypothetical protein HaLaN_10236 [Haematococcus lacustris]|uniref:Uncharacterized protein n=1 Tax=Haematococcus lacustris TaxID=44745 RepID=A0A699YWY7_HAELA|nr:hypothetical protein HaLaN_10236 [Haematococcus lacustris]